MSRLYKIEEGVLVLSRIRKIMNELLINCAYSEHNIEVQLSKLDRYKVPQWEKDILIKSYEVKRKRGKEIFKQLEELLDYYAEDNT